MILEKIRGNQEELTIRTADIQDVSAIFDLIKELAIYEKLQDFVVTDEESIRKTLFGERAYAEVQMATLKEEAVGMVIFFHNYSTFLGKPGLYIEDLFVKEAFRGLGIGKALFLKCVQIARERNCGRMEWSVLNWNPARKFYEKLGAYALKEWLVYRIDQEVMDKILKIDSSDRIDSI